MKPSITSILIVALQLAVFSAMLWYNEEHPFFSFDLTASSILLTASAVILTGTAVIVAVVGMVGFQFIQRKSEEAAIKTAEDIAAKVAKEVATKVATTTASRTAFEATLTEGDVKNADDIAKASRGDE